MNLGFQMMEYFILDLKNSSEIIHINWHFHSRESFSFENFKESVIELWFKKITFSFEIIFFIRDTLKHIQDTIILSSPTSFIIIIAYPKSSEMHLLFYPTSSAIQPRSSLIRDTLMFIAGPLKGEVAKLENI
ncbi:hypothetical protein HanIR_Chr15g0761761 [Helianthus annuus]|nr:hypothetical protein HanIR_Chr15g0761761 [Helianthus annuus]